MSSITKAELSLGHSDNLFNRLTLKTEDKIEIPIELLHRTFDNKGRPKGQKTLPFTEQVLLGFSANLEGSTKAAEAFGVSIPTADGYKDASSEQSVKNPKVKPELRSALDSVLNQAKNLAGSKVLSSIQSINDESVIKLGKEKPLLAAELAVKMSTVVEKLTPKENRNEGNKVQVIVYGPEERNESKYERIDVALNMEDR